MKRRSLQKARLFLRRLGGGNPLSPKKGMTLLEVMATLAIFAFIFLFMSRMFRAYVKRQEKISGRAEISRVNENVFSVLKQDLKGALFFYDIHAHFPSLYPVLDEAETETPAEGRSAAEEERPAPFNAMDPRFDFIGKQESLQFVTVVYSPSGTADPPRPALARIDYFLRSCTIFKTEEESRCLARSVNFNWQNWDDDKENSASANMIAGVKSLRFSYIEDGELLREWRFSNRWKAASKNPNAQTALFPALVKAEIEWESGGEPPRRFTLSQNFAVSHFLLRFHYPGELSSLAFLNIKKGRARKEEQEKTEAAAEQEEAGPQGPQENIDPRRGGPGPLDRTGFPPDNQPALRRPP